MTKPKRIAKRAATIYDRIREILESARVNVTRSVNTTQVVSNWLVGREIVEEQQHGEKRAGYGENLIPTLSKQITADFGRGYSVNNLEHFRAFYLAYPELLTAPIPHALRGELMIEAAGFPKPHAPRGKSDVSTTDGIANSSPRKSSSGDGQFSIHHAARDKSWQPGELHPNLSWTHYRTLLRVESVDARGFYEIEAIKNNWSARELERQINSLLYERLAKSKDKDGLMHLATAGQDLAGQAVSHFRKYLDEDDVRKVLQFYQTPIAKLVHVQMQKHYWEKSSGTEVKVSKGFTELKPSAYTALASEPVRRLTRWAGFGKISEQASRLCCFPRSPQCFVEGLSCRAVVAGLCSKGWTPSHGGEEKTDNGNSVPSACSCSIVLNIYEKHAIFTYVKIVRRQPQSIENRIRTRIHRSGRGSVFVPVDFLDLGNRQGVDFALHRLVEQGVLRRLARGLYDFPKSHPQLGTLTPSMDAIATALAGRDRIRIQPSGAYAANLLHLSEQVPAKAVFLTDGPSRRLKIGASEIIFKRTTPRAMAAAGRMSGLVIQGLKYLGRPNVTMQRIAPLRNLLSEKDRQRLKQDMPLAPAWMRPFLQYVAQGNELA